MRTFHLINFGCRASQADGFALKRQLLEAGLEEATQPEQSSVAVLNTCTVTATADAEVRQVIRRLHRLNPSCRIVVTGCYAQRAPEEIMKLEGVAWVIGNSHKHKLADLLGANSGTNQPQGQQGFEDRPSGGGTAVQVLVGEIGDTFHFAPVFADDRTRPTLKVQDGCNARCAFCTIPRVRGPSRSLAPALVIEQVRELERAGAKEIVLSGINLGSYGKDLDRRLSLLKLLEQILAQTSLPRLRISSIEPMDVSPELIGLIAGETRMARHFHVPLQSGCDRILRLMSRRYWAEQYADRILSIHAQIPNCGVGADVMVGFPGETAQDHRVSARFIEGLPFTYLHIFPYSRRPGTPAAQRPDQPEGRAVRERSQEIRSLMAAKRRAFLEAQRGQTLSVLTLGETRDTARLALSSNFLKVFLTGANLAENQLLDVRVGCVAGDTLYGDADVSRGVEGPPIRAGQLSADHAE